jgi:DNA-nicking Smr family endonuclease
VDKGSADEQAEAERRLFRDAVRDVRRLELPAPQPPAPTRRPAPRARFAAADRHAVLAESLALPARPWDPVPESGEELQFRRDGLPPTVYRKLRAGQYRVEAELDLHGLTVAAAEPAIAAFLVEARARRWRVVRVVHGKGNRSGHRGPVLKRLVNAYLQRVDAVLAFASAREVDGGSGACLVLLGRSR